MVITDVEHSSISALPGLIEENVLTFQGGSQATIHVYVLESLGLLPDSATNRTTRFKHGSVKTATQTRCGILVICRLHYQRNRKSDKVASITVAQATARIRNVRLPGSSMYSRLFDLCDYSLTTVSIEVMSTTSVYSHLLLRTQSLATRNVLRCLGAQRQDEALDSYQMERFKECIL